MDILQELLGPVPIHEFLHRPFTRVPFAMPDRAARYTQDFTEADIAAIVEQGHSILRIVCNGRLVHETTRMAWAEAQAYYRRGHTLLVWYAEWSSAKCQALAEAFAQFFHSPVDIQVYVMPDQSQAFGWHYDLEEVFIIQVQGCKEDTIWQNTLNPLPVWDTMPTDMAYERDTARLRLTCRLDGGWRLALHSMRSPMQTRAQSTLEVLVDFACSMLMNIGGQLLFYHAVATVGRVTLFAALVLGLAFARRFATRRFFEALVPLGTRQPHWQSVVESIVDTGLGYGVAVALQMLVYGETATLLRASSLTFVIYGLTMVRRYILRRIFAAMALRTA